MKNAIQKFKNIIGIDSEKTTKLAVEEEKFELKENVDKIEAAASEKIQIVPEETFETRACDVCKEHEITTKSMNLVKILADGTKEFKLEKPRVTYIGGDNKNGVLMCEECLKNCDTEDKTGFIWAAGMINIVEENIEAVESKRQSLYATMEEIKSKAEAEINKLLSEDASLVSEIKEMKMNKEQLIQHQQFLGNKIDAEMRTQDTTNLNQASN